MKHKPQFAWAVRGADQDLLGRRDSIPGYLSGIPVLGLTKGSLECAELVIRRNTSAQGVAVKVLAAVAETAPALEQQRLPPEQPGMVVTVTMASHHRKTQLHSLRGAGKKQEGQ